MPYKDKDGKWRGVVKIGGKRVAQRKFKLLREAEKWEKEERERILARSQKIGMDFIAFSNQYLDFAQQRYGKKTYEEKVSITKRFLAFLGDNMLVEDITPRHLSEYLLIQTKERSANASNKDRKNLLSMWNWGVKILDIPSNPVGKTEKFRHDRSIQYTPTEEDVLKVLAVASGVDRAFLECYLQTGARRSEIFKLTWSDVNFERREITLKTRKTRDGSTKTRTLPMSDKLYDELWWWWNSRDRNFRDLPWVFVDDHPGPHTGKPYIVRRRFLKSLCEKAGVEPFGFHALRRYVASILSDKYKVSTPTIQKILGHEKLSTTDRYVQNISGDMVSALGMLGDGREITKTSVPQTVPQ